ncbi:Delta-1-pyrroline-5-carboxylate dehydrogenase mitochondrial [Dissostichus eleginoides]|uniref:Delta-1-pyrroline-5-carboxylate dehydrogenase mitochondrial n=1 Tax=Dissostichus eleginoides TaxID=100907 RepID=A0AAD9BFH4_DISEL|nr:Delta-1-pyrroline-5-carboxylate dehydrogenase mitochondrial [Dissostichus eleginoides]
MPNYGNATQQGKATLKAISVQKSPPVKSEHYFKSDPWASLSGVKIAKRHRWLPSAEHAVAPVFPQRCIAVTAGSDKHVPSRSRTTDESENRALRRAFMYQLKPSPAR